MSTLDRDLESYMTTMAAALGLSITPESRPLVMAHLRAMLAAAALVMDFPLPDDVEAAPIFRP